MRRCVVFFVLLSFVFLPKAWGQTEPIIVTATRTSQTVESTLASVSVITRADIEELQPVGLSELLQSVPGVKVSNTGGLGQPSALFIRGAESDHVLVLIDGVRTGSATLGTTSFQYIDPEQIERIEIVRGPRSSLYGSDAIGGVVQIFTRKSFGSEKFAAKIVGGTDDYSKLGLRFSNKQNGNKFTVAVNHEKTSGYNVCSGSLSAGCFTIENDRDGYENTTAQLYFDTTSIEGNNLSISLMSSNGKTEYDGSYSNESDFSLSVASAILDFSLSNKMDSKITLGISQDNSDSLKDSVFVDRFDTEKVSLGWQNDIFITSQNLLTIGLDALDDQVSSTTSYSVNSRTNLGIYAQFLGSLGSADVQAAVRLDDNEQFGDTVTGDLSFGSYIDSGGRWVLQYGTAFKAPTFNELYYPGFGNSNLEPEESATLEASYRHEFDNWSIASTIFSTDVENLIAYDATTFAPGNVDAAKISGLEMEIHLEINSWEIDSTLTLLSTEQDGGSYDGNKLPRRPGELIEVRLRKKMNRSEFGASILASGSTYDNLANSIVLNSYQVIGLNASYLVTPKLKLIAKASNLLDEDYENAAYYNQPGQEFFFGLKLAN